MNFKFRAVGFAFGVALISLSAQSIAKADNFQFSFATDPAGCVNYSGGCGAANGMGTFTTAPVTVSPQFGNFNVYPIESLAGVFNGASMTLNNAGQSAIVQSDLNLPMFGPGVIFTAGGQQFELEYNEGPSPAGSPDLLFSFANNTFTNVALTVTPVSVPEPSELALAGAGLFGLAGLKLFRRKLT